MTQCALAFVPPNRGVAPVSWPGPAQPFDWSVEGRALTLAHPAAVAPVVVVLAPMGASWWARRPAPDSSAPHAAQVGVGRTEARRAQLVVGIPALALSLGAVARRRRGTYWWRRTPTAG
ncbi:MAG: hypothetical protein HHJ14_00685 [Cellulomonas sp.]|uniref:hypothetical protein n=1 Tax=Cellulomonas sp. TaxID=40001 RepID=UPI00181890B0|nr:hypothetical protein [Cellulomonas sp.]NMM15683.1 hypothetical protein [Cellulomonas sp.]NMM32054.1 hypothetical protein [Cellulomonas sp.]